MARLFCAVFVKTFLELRLAFYRRAKCRPISHGHCSVAGALRPLLIISKQGHLFTLLIVGQNLIIVVCRLGAANPKE